MTICEVQFLKSVPYEAAWKLQKDLAVARGRSDVPDTLLLLEHPHTYTLGSAGTLDNLLMSEAERESLGVSVHHVDRGGDITYHGPGQLVGYPIFQLRRTIGGLHADVIHYVRQLEDALILALKPFGIQGELLENFTGVWVRVGDHLEKVAAIGVKITARAVTQHGFALNIHPDMRFFDGIIPCGIPDKPVTTMEKLLGEAPAFEMVMDEVVRAVGIVFERDMVARTGAPLLK